MKVHFAFHLEIKDPESGGRVEYMGIVKRKMRDTRPNNADDPKAAIIATWASITPEHISV